MINIFLAIWIGIPHAGAIDCREGTFKRRAHPRTAYYRGDGTFVRATHVIDSCIPKRPGHDLWFPKLKSGLPPKWPHDEAMAKWTEEQRDRVLEALSELPEKLWDKSIKGIYRLSRPKDFPNPATHGGDMIVLYDSAFDQSHRLARILAHELAHQIYDQFGLDDGADYRRVAGWQITVEESKVYWVPRSDGFVKDNVRRDPSEDFAANLEYLLFEPEVLRKKTPKVYEWLKRRFGDKFKLRGGS